MRPPVRPISRSRTWHQCELWLPWVVLLLAFGAPLMASGQTTTPPPLPPKSDQTGPTVPPTAGTGFMERGVIHPPAVDPGIARGTPNPREYPTPVIPPPGSPGGDQRIQPK